MVQISFKKTYITNKKTCFIICFLVRKNKLHDFEIVMFISSVDYIF